MRSSIKRGFVTYLCDCDYGNVRLRLVYTQVICNTVVWIGGSDIEADYSETKDMVWYGVAGYGMVW